MLLKEQKKPSQISELVLDIKSILAKYPFPVEREKAQAIIIKHFLTFKLSYLEANPGSDDTIVFLHGNSASGRMFNPLLNHYKDSHRVVAPTFLGHAESTHINQFKQLNEDEQKTIAKVLYNPFCMIETLMQFLSKVQIKHAHLLGYSLGGHFAYAIATENPTLVDSVVTFASPPVKFSTSGLKKGFTDYFLGLVESWCTKPTRYSAEQAIAIANAMGITERDAHVLIEDLIAADPLMRQGLFAQCDILDEECFNNTVIDGESALQKIDAPVLLMVGEGDISIKPIALKSAAQTLKNPLSALKVMPEVTHNIFSFKDFIPTFDQFMKTCFREVKTSPENR